MIEVTSFLIAALLIQYFWLAAGFVFEEHKRKKDVLIALIPFSFFYVAYLKFKKLD